MRGYWWSPAGDALVVARVDDTPVQRWHIADPAHPDRVPTVVAYPAAGTPNAQVSAEIITLDGRRTPIRWTEEYLADVVWDDQGLFVVVQPRDQTALRTLRVDPGTGATTPDHERTDPIWVDIVPGVPAHTAAGALVTVADADGARRLSSTASPSRRRPCRCVVCSTSKATPCCSGRARTRSRSGCGLGARRALVARTAAAACTPAGCAAARWCRPPGPRDRRDRHDGRRGGAVATITSFAEPSGLVPASRCSARARATCRPRCCCRPGTSRAPGCPCCMDPYGGPHAQRVVAARNAHLTVAVVRRPGLRRGRRRRPRHAGARPGLGARRSTATSPRSSLDDQVDALHALAAEHPDLDLARVGDPRLVVRRLPRRAGRAAPPGRVPRRGRRRARSPTGALYDTHYTERYLGLPDDRSRGVRAELAARRRRPRSWTGRCCSPRPGRRQRRRRAHAAAVVGAARGRAAAQRAAAVGRHAHDAAGGRRGEPPAPAGRFLKEALA